MPKARNNHTPEEKVAQALSNPLGLDVPTWWSVLFPLAGTGLACHTIVGEGKPMGKPRAKQYTRALEEVMGEKSYILSKAQAFSEMGMAETAHPLWASAGAYEERIAPLLDLLGRDLEASAHRISAASCYEKAGDPSRAANLYRAALSGPLAEDVRGDVQRMLAGCLVYLARSAKKRITARGGQQAAATPT
ncbi:MAG: hypothetical protein HY321_16190 [Armatimonadetes bacterium]|nr:hypothetical protein [Armatimonadota bacterium]